MEYNIVRPKPIFAQIIDQIKSQIISGELKPGDQLPPERQFSEMMGVNRHTVREALKVLEYVGAIESKMGVGTIVKSAGQEVLLDQISQAAEFSPSQLLSEIMELRQILEPGIAAMAAERATEQDFAFMEQTMADFTKEFEMGSLGTDADERLHIALANATQNSTIIRLVKPILTMLGQYREKSLRLKDRRMQTYEEHSRIYTAVKNRQPEEARKAMVSHLSMVKAIIKI